jgi:hypothetical protein
MGEKKTFAIMPRRIIFSVQLSKSKVDISWDLGATSRRVKKFWKGEYRSRIISGSSVCPANLEEG